MDIPLAGQVWPIRPTLLGPQDTDAFSLDLVVVTITFEEEGSKYISEIPIMRPTEPSRLAPQESTKMLTLSQG